METNIFLLTIEKLNHRLIHLFLSLNVELYTKNSHFYATFQFLILHHALPTPQYA